MDRQNLPIVGLILAAVIAFLPSGAPTPGEGDSLDQANETYREILAQTVIKFRDKERTTQSAEEFTKVFSDYRKQIYEGPAREIMALWWNGEVEEAARRIRERKLGEQEEIPNEQ